MRISDWSSDVCSSDLAVNLAPEAGDIDRAVAFEIPFEREVVILRMRRPQIRGARRSAAIAHVGEIAGQRIIRIEVREIGTSDSLAPIEFARATCRESVCLSVEHSVGAVARKKK